MDKWQIAKLLYAAGYEHREVRAIWAYVWNEQNIGRSGKKRIPWQRKALDSIGITPEEVQFTADDSGELSSYF